MRMKISLWTRRLMASPTALHRMAVVFVGSAIVLVGWMVFLAQTLHGSTTVRNWSTVWIGLDTMEALALAALGVCLVRRDHRARTAATVAATLFGMDAWFDVMLSNTTKDLLMAAVLAVFFEIPLAACCAGIARQAARWYDM
jgi:ammonia channel protein AmtB